MEIRRRYGTFLEDLPEMLSELRLDEDEMTYNDYTNIVAEWLTMNG